MYFAGTIQVDPMVGKQRQLCFLDLGLVVGSYRHDAECDSEPVRDGLQIRMVGNDYRNFNEPFAGIGATGCRTDTMVAWTRTRPCAAVGRKI